MGHSLCCRQEVKSKNMKRLTFILILIQAVQSPIARTTKNSLTKHLSLDSKTPKSRPLVPTVTVCHVRVCSVWRKNWDRLPTVLRKKKQFNPNGKPVNSGDDPPRTHASNSA